LGSEEKTSSYVERKWETTTRLRRKNTVDTSDLIAFDLTAELNVILKWNLVHS
jgi:hypothetical protein